MKELFENERHSFSLFHDFRKSQRENALYCAGHRHPIIENTLPIQISEKNGEMFLSDLQIIGFWALKNARSIAETLTIGAG
jgi:hypothetical protein